MTLAAGTLLASHDHEADPGLWFLIYADDEGAVGFDLTSEHPDIPYGVFESRLNFANLMPDAEKLVLLGGPERRDDALIILHETAAATPESTVINGDFSFLSYTYVLLPGQPPSFNTPDNQPTELKLKKPSPFLVSMGYRVFDTPALDLEIEAGNWLALPATPDIVFHTPRLERRTRLLNRMN